MSKEDKQLLTERIKKTEEPVAALQQLIEALKVSEQGIIKRIKEASSVSQHDLKSITLFCMYSDLYW